MTSIACHAPIRDKSVYQVRLAIVFFCVTSVIVGLRFYQRIFLSSGLYADDYLILLSYVRTNAWFLMTPLSNNLLTIISAVGLRDT